MAKLIGLSGYARSGKDTVGDYLVEHHGFKKVSFAEPMRQALYALNPSLGDYGTVQFVIDEHGWDGYKKYPEFDEIRELMQRLGTEVGRKQFGENFWVDKACKLIETYLFQDMNVVITDVRFVNEAIAIESLRGQVWRIQREGVEPANAHPSETALDTYGFNHIVFNNGTLDDLYENAERLIGSF